MNGRGAMAVLLLVPALMMSMAPTAGAQRPASTLPSGNRIVAQDGDVVVVENDARVRIVRRREANVRVVFNAAERWLLLLVDHAMPAGSADGHVDYAHYYTGIGGDWPFGARSEGPATIEEYSMVAQGSRGLGIATSQGLVQVFPSQQEFRDANAVAVLTHRGGGSSSVGVPFDEAERWYTAELRRGDGIIRSPSGASGSFSMSVGGGFNSRTDSSGIVRAGDAVRVGGNVRPPVKLVDVPPVRPEMAERANTRGIVILEVIIDVDGAVKEARVLRSVPIFDTAALEAVRQWRYEPTMIDGRPVPVIMTVSVGF
jgi:TonB family protein